mmetsp:Transcript_47330/g.106723  ORF Transcript_47330/g.106723 Transcript_47330/m.106723 type:complete len:289 (-) Transcript_47330:44-910(-)
MLVCAWPLYPNRGLTGVSLLDTLGRTLEHVRIFMTGEFAVLLLIKALVGGPQRVFIFAGSIFGGEMRPFNLRPHPEILDLHHLRHRGLIPHRVFSGCLAEILHHHRTQLVVARLVFVLEVGTLVIVLLQELPFLLLLAMVHPLLGELFVFPPPLSISQVSSSLQLRLLRVRCGSLLPLALHTPELSHLPVLEFGKLVDLVVVVRHLLEVDGLLLATHLVLPHRLHQQRPALFLALLRPLFARQPHCLLLRLFCLSLLDCLTVCARDEDWFQHFRARRLVLIVRIRLVL